MRLFPQAFQKLKPDRFEGECQLFLLLSGVLPIYCWRENKDSWKSPRIFSGCEFAPSCLHTPTSAACGCSTLLALSSTSFSSLTGLLSHHLWIRVVVITQQCPGQVLGTQGQGLSGLWKPSHNLLWPDMKKWSPTLPVSKVIHSLNSYTQKSSGFAPLGPLPFQGPTWLVAKLVSHWCKQ